MMESETRIEVPDVRIVIRTSRRDCIVSDWSAWSGCSEVCSMGTQSRTRTVTVSPTSDGLACPVLTQVWGSAGGLGVCVPCA